MLLFRHLPTMLLGLFLLAACGGEPSETDAPEGTLQGSTDAASTAPLDTTEDISVPVSFFLSERAELSLFLELLEETDLKARVDSGRDMIVIAPTDTALEALPGEALATLRSPALRDELQSLIKHHLVEMRVNSDMLGREVETLTSLYGVDIPVRSVGDLLTVADAVVLDVIDVPDFNSTILMVDAVLLPPEG